MAPGLKQWAAAAAVACAATTLWLLPPSPPDVQARRPGVGAGDASPAQRLQQRVSYLQRVLAAAEVEERIRSRVASTPERVVVDVPDGVADTARVAHEAGVRARLASLGMEEPRVTVVRATVPSRLGAYEAEGWSWSGWTGWMVYQGAVDGEPYCAVVYRSGQPVRAVADARAAASGGRGDRDALRFCRFHARHGPPGRHVARWLERDGGFALAMLPASTPEGRSGLPGAARRVPFGTSAVIAVADPEHGACLAGDLEACADGILTLDRFVRWTGRPSDDLPATPGFEAHFLRWSGFGLAYERYGYSYLADLEEAFGRERFRRFWRSDRPVPEAFREAFGESVGAYTHRWATARLGTLAAGPAPSAASGLLGLLTVALLAGTGLWVGVRRTPG